MLEDTAVSKFDSIDMETIMKEHKSSSEFTDSFSRDFPQLDSLVDGVSLTKEKDTPFVGDTTISGLVHQMPRSAIKQLPVFGVTVNGSKNNLKSLLSKSFLRDKIFNENTFGKGVVSTLQLSAEQSIAHGYSSVMAATGSVFGEFGVNMRMIHYKDLAVESGIQDNSESSFHYVRANTLKSRLQKIYNKALDNPDSTWNPEALKELLDQEPRSYSYSDTLTDPRISAALSNPTSGYQLVTKYEVGQGGQFITFCHQVPDKPLRVVDNKSKFGYPKVQMLVIDHAPLTPFGLSRVRLASPHQNLANAYLQNIAATFILNSRPPVLQKGKFNKPVVLKQGVKWETNDPNGDVTIKSMDNGSLSQFVNIMNYISSQIQNIMGSSNGSSDGGFSKTSPGVKMQKDFIDLSTNQLTNILENFVRQYALVALDTYICEQEGEEDIVVDDETKNAINRLTPGAVGDDNSIHINWGEFYDSIKTWSVDIELSIGKDELDEKRRADLQDTLTVLVQNAEVLGPETVEKVKKIIDMLLEQSAPEAGQLVNNQQPQLPAAQAVPQPEVTPQQPAL